MTLDIENRGDSFVGDSDRDGGAFYTPQCYTCKNKVDLHTCSIYSAGIPVSIITGDVVCNAFLSS